METKEHYWQTYFDAATVTEVNAIRTAFQVASIGVQLHVDAYEQTPTAPVFIFNHGGGGYSRLFAPLALALFKRGYTVLLPDQIGQGLSPGTRRDLTVANFVQNIVDVAHYARQRYDGPIVLAGGSLGGGLTYHAAAAGAPADALVCHNLYEFGHTADVLALSTLSWATAVPGLPFLLAKSVQLLATLLPDLPIPYRLLGRFDRMVDQSSADFYAKWLADPVPLRWVTLRYLQSMFATKAAVPYHKNQHPLLVINPTRDEMVDPAVTQRNYARLSGPKAYAELPCAHWALGDSFVRQWVEVVHAWYQETLMSTAG